MTAPDHRAGIIRAYRDLADFLEQHPQVPEPWGHMVNVFADLDGARAATHLTGAWHKDYSGDYVAYVKTFGPLEFHLNVNRDQVCRQVQAGVKHVEAVEAHDEPVFEWVCDEPPAAGAGQVEAAGLMSAGGSA